MTASSLRLEGKVAIVTGGSTGIGRAISPWGLPGRVLLCILAAGGWLSWSRRCDDLREERPPGEIAHIP